jgi:SAM-dependent methyltransferase
MNKALVLKDINNDLPRGIDWRAGAQSYVKSFFDKHGRLATEKHALTKPFLNLAEGDDFARAELTGYFYNYVNLVHRIKPTAGMRVLDVACGGGWFAHYMAKIGCETFGIDISEDFIDLARRRFREDRHLGIADDEIDARFAVHDIEATPLPAKHHGKFDLVVLESCLHHFVDPIAAMTHIVSALTEDGIVVVIEGENRKGRIRDEYMAVMREYDTLERPYTRKQFEAVLDLAGLPEREFMGQLNGWFSLQDEVAQNATWWIEQAEDSMNLAVCARKPAPLQRIFPDRIDAALRFGHGWYGLQSNGFRWCGPTGHIRAHKAVRDLRLAIHGHGKAQTVVAYGPKGELGRAVFSDALQSATLGLGDLDSGDSVMLCSDTAFNPSWGGSEDDRLLAFYLQAHHQR